MSSQRDRAQVMVREYREGLAEFQGLRLTARTSAEQAVSRAARATTIEVSRTIIVVSRIDIGHCSMFVSGRKWEWTGYGSLHASSCDLDCRLRTRSRDSYVHDGHTVWIEGEKIRLADIDTPDLNGQ